jgi:magnesium transporter
MKTLFVIDHGEIVSSSSSAADATILAYLAPSADEKRQILETIGLPSHDLESALDPDEIPRLEFSPTRLSLIWKRPQSVPPGDRLRFEVQSVGFFLQDNRLLVIMPDDALPFSSRDFQAVTSTTDVLLRFLRHTVKHYLGHLKVVRQLTTDLESKISTSMENRYLLQMFGLGESLIYYLTAIEANGAVMTKLQAASDKLALTTPEREFLDDIILDNRQCGRQAQIYSSVLSGLMDARGNIINNNMNVLLKNLTLINIIFLPLNLIASIGGMSEFSMMTHGVDWRLAYGVFALAMGIMGWATWIVLVHAIDRRQRKHIRQGR